MGDRALQILVAEARLPSLRRLTVTGRERGPYIKRQPTPFTDDGVRALARSPSIESLRFYFCGAMTAAGIEALGELATLRSLSLTGAPYTPASIGALQQVEELRIGGDTLTDEVLKAVAALPSLKRLHLASARNVTAGGLAAVAHLPGTRPSG